MKRIMRNAIASGGVALSLLAAVPARADHDKAGEHRGGLLERGPGLDPVRLWDRHDALARERHDLEEARERFYGRWHGDPRDRARFERWYAARCAELDRRADASHAYGHWSS